MFDVKPVDESGSIDVERIRSVQPVVNLRPKKEKKFPIKKSAVIETPAIPTPPAGITSKRDIKEEFQELINYDLDLGVELAKFSLPVSQTMSAKPRYRVIKKKEQENYAPILTEIHHSAAAVRKETVREEQIETPSAAMPPMETPLLQVTANPEVESFYTQRTQLIVQKHKAYQRRSLFKFPRPSHNFLLISLAAFAILGLLVRYGFHLKRQITAQSAAAVSSLETAGTNLQALDFKDASENFFSAYSDFSKAGNNLNVLGSGITDIISSLPGAGSLKSAKNLLQVGQLLSAAGTSMTAALDGISKTGALKDPTGSDLPLAQIASALKTALISAQQEVNQAGSLVADIDPSIIPADKVANFNELKTKLPEMETAMNLSADYAKFFENLVTPSGDKRYLVMFQNGSELRPTGGFPGTYGVISFSGGKLQSIFVDDVYNLDGQLKQNIIPPLQLQHITPNWGMRDANWYPDFPTSAKNIESFYKKESGQSVDGVIVINPDMIQKILAIVGPVQMPQYNLTLTSDNILTTIQDQVEYGPNRTQPKQIVKDFAPLLISKIYSAGSDKWLQIFSTLMLGMNQHEIMMNFNDLSLESFVTDQGFGGQVPAAAAKGATDFLMPVITNVKGSKTDAVTDTDFSVSTTFSGNDAIHTLTITRTHNGGDSKFGFYNKQNPAYVRVLVPDDAQLVSVQGNDQPNFQPLINYAQDKSFVRDDQLTQFETSGITDSATGVTTYRESGKSEFGFWLITDPGKTKTVTVTYKVPNALSSDDYELYVQKQPSLVVKNFDFSLQPPPGLTPDASHPALTQNSSGYDYSAPLTDDLDLKVTFK